MRRVYIGKFSHHIRERDIERFFRSEGRIREVLMKDGFAFVEFEHTNDAESAVKRLDGRDLSGERVHVEFAKGPPRTARDGMRYGANTSMNRSTPSMDRPSNLRGSRDFRNDRGGRDRGDRDRGDRGDRDRGDTRSSGMSYAEKYGPPRNTDFRVIVENLSSRVSWQDLKDLMRQAGEVTFADAHKRERNVGIVDFATDKDMRHAIESLNDSEFHGRRIKIYEDKERRLGEGGKGGNGRHDRRDIGSGGRSRSRSKSRSRTRSRSRSRSKSHSRTRSRSRSRSKTPTGARSRSRSRSKSISRSRSRSRSLRLHSNSRSPSQERAKSRSRTRSPA